MPPAISIVVMDEGTMHIFDNNNSYASLWQAPSYDIGRLQSIVLKILTVKGFGVPLIDPNGIRNGIL